MKTLSKSKAKKSEFFSRKKKNHLRCKYLTNKIQQQREFKRGFGRFEQFLVVKVINLSSKSLKNIFPAHY